MEDFQVKDKTLAPQGRLQIEWASRHMPVLNLIKNRFEKEKPLKGLTLGACLHVTKETAVLVQALTVGGAKVALCGSNPLSTQDDVAAALAESGVHVFAWRGQNTEEYYKCIDNALDYNPTITLDDGADLVGTLHSKRQAQLKNVKGGTEETTTGVIRLRAMEKDGSLKYPIVAVNDAYTKYLFDNRYGTGQSTMDGILRATSVLIAGKNFVVGGYGWCSRGIAMRAFTPREGTQVDLKSFRLEYLKLISIDITGRVAGYLGPTGVRIERADLPPGDHKLRITLKDTKRGISQQVYSVKIAK